MDSAGVCIITGQIEEAINRQLATLRASSVTVLCDENTAAQCYPLIQSSLPAHHLITVPSGEEHKNIEGAVRIWDHLTRLHIDRKGVLIILGGGVLGDMGGFCAATYKRGIRFILVPTTLLAQVDASVGGKLGIDFGSYKNHIGVFRQPEATIIDTRFLQTLPASELRSGFAEVIKHCFLSDPEKWQRVRKTNLQGQDWQELVAHSVNFKQSVVERDPLESGLRKILNFGHTIGHAVESKSLEGHNRLLHGEAITIGMICESWLAVKKGLLAQECLNELKDYILSIFGHRNPEGTDEELISLMLQDKKSAEGKILLALADGKGGYQWDVEATAGEIAESIAYYRNLA